MHSIETLNIVGHRNEILPSTFFRQKDESPHIAVIFPGFGYTAQMPLLYYPGRLLLQSGADVLLVAYNYFKRAAGASAGLPSSTSCAGTAGQASTSTQNAILIRRISIKKD